MLPVNIPGLDKGAVLPVNIPGLDKGTVEVEVVRHDDGTYHTHSLQDQDQHEWLVLLESSVAKPPLFGAPPAPDGQGPGADSGSGSSSRQKRRSRRLRLLLHTLKIFILSFQKVNY